MMNTKKMSSRLSYLFMAMILMTGSMSLQAQTHRNGYTVSRGKAYYDGKAISGAHVRTFEILGNGYAKDRNHVYLDGRVLRNVDARTFDRRSMQSMGERMLGKKNRGSRSDYYKSSFDVFYKGQKIQGASVSSFRMLGGGYAKDAFNVYYRGQRMRDASASSFRILDGGYAKDAFNVYYRGQRVKDASASSFRVEGDGYARDAFNTYYMGKRAK